MTKGITNHSLKKYAHTHTLITMSLIYTVPSDGNNPNQRRNSLYLGGQSEAKSLSTLQRWGVKYILNVTPEKDSSILAGVPNYFEKTCTAGFVYKRIPVYDAATSNLLEYADKAVAFISNGLHHSSVLVHCQKGISRSTSIVLFFLMRKVGMTLDAAMNLCKKRRPMVDPIPAFISQLQIYEGKCRDLGLIQRDYEEEEGGQSQASNSNRESPSKGLKRKAIGPAMPPIHIQVLSTESVHTTDPSSRTDSDEKKITPENKVSSKDVMKAHLL